MKQLYYISEIEVKITVLKSQTVKFIFYLLFR